MACLRQAKEESGKETAEFHAQMEREFQSRVAEGSRDSGANVKWLDQETESKIEQLKIEGSRISHDIVEMLLKHVMMVLFVLEQSSGDSGANVKWLDQETESKIGQLKVEGSRVLHDVVQMLLKHVTTVKN